MIAYLRAKDLLALAQEYPEARIAVVISTDNFERHYPVYKAVPLNLEQLEDPGPAETYLTLSIDTQAPVANDPAGRG